MTEFVRFTNRIPLTQDFTPTVQEQRLYDEVSEYLQRDSLNALPAGQRKRMTLVLRTLLASSTFAIAGTLETLAGRLRSKHEAPDPIESLDDFETIDEVKDEWDDEPADAEAPPAAPGNGTMAVPAQIQAEIEELQGYGHLAASITENAKGWALLTALKEGFKKLDELGAPRKAVIFTESRRTQSYLMDLLGRKGYAGRILTINGTNADDRSGTIYKDWVKRHAGEPLVTGNQAVDLRAALVEHFRDSADVLIATEAAAEGVNLQFCALVVNYDLPWNPQRIEQRIGRCHRYGQKHDVVVINFVNRSNAADERAFDLLSEKFRLFEGVFGSSDEVLGVLESGVDFERRIAEIYQSCRTTEEIDRAFTELRNELEQQIAARRADTRTKLLENFDEEVHQKLRVNLAESRGYLDRLERWLWTVTRHELDGLARFCEDELAFDLDQAPTGCESVPCGRYQFVTRSRESEEHPAHRYRLGHPPAEFVIERAKARTLPVARVRFDYAGRQGKIGLVEDLVGRSGWLTLARMTVKALEDEDRLVFAAVDTDGNPIEAEAAEKLFHVDGAVLGTAEASPETAESLRSHLDHRRDAILAEIGERNTRFFEEQIDKLDRWADDLKNGLETEIKDLSAGIKQLGREARLAPDLETKLELQRKKAELESQRSKKQRSLFEAQDEIEARKEALIAEVEVRLQQSHMLTPLFTIPWEMV